MNNSSASQFMDKQIMDLSNSQSNINSSSGNTDFIDFMNRPPEKKEDIVPSYDFVPIRPSFRSSSPPAARPSDFDSGDDGAAVRTWNSFDSKTNASATRNYSSLDAGEPVKSILEKNHKAGSVHSDVSLVSEIEKTVKKYVDDVMHAVDGMSARLSQLETRTRNLENSIDDLKVSVGSNHGSIEGKMRLLENILREVQTGVQFIKDRTEIVGAQQQMAKLQVAQVEKQVESQGTAYNAHTETIQAGASAHPQLSTVPQNQPPPTIMPPNVPPPPPPQLNIQPQIQPPNQFPQNHVPSVPQRESYFPAPGQTPENPTQHYQAPPPQQQHSAPPPPQHPYPPPSQPQYSQPPPPAQPQYSQTPPPSQPQFSQPPPQPHPSFSGFSPSQSHHPEETPYVTPQTYSSGTNLPPSHHSTGVPHPPPQQYYSPASNVYEPPSSRPGPGYSGSFGPSSGHGEPYPPPPYGSGSPVKPQQLSSFVGQSSGSGYPQLPTARILPQALPTASGVSGGSGSSGNRVPIDDVVDRVTHMGFPRDQVRATVRKLTENGQAVDLNVVLDKLMNDGDGQAPRGWLGR